MDQAGITVSMQQLGTIANNVLFLWVSLLCQECPFYLNSSRKPYQLLMACAALVLLDNDL